MKLNYDCVRDLMLALEKHLDLSEEFLVESLSLPKIIELDELKPYSESQIVYTIKKLKEADYIKADIIYADNTIYMLFVSEITFNGHQFLELIQSQSMWDKAKEVFAKTANITLPIILQTCIDLAKSQLL